MDPRDPHTAPSRLKDGRVDRIIWHARVEPRSSLVLSTGRFFPANDGRQTPRPIGHRPRAVARCIAIPLDSQGGSGAADCSSQGSANRRRQELWRTPTLLCALKVHRLSCIMSDPPPGAELCAESVLAEAFDGRAAGRGGAVGAEMCKQIIFELYASYTSRTEGLYRG